MARMGSPQEMLQGGVLNGNPVDPVNYLLGNIHARFSALEEESRLNAMTQMLAHTHAERRYGQQSVGPL